MEHKKLTKRQESMLEHVRTCKVVSTGSDSSVLEALCSKGLVVKHFNSSPSGVYFTWTVAIDKSK